MPSELGELLSRAEAGDSESQRDLAIRLQNGDGVAPDPERSRFWLKCAAENGDAWSQTQHAILLRSTKLPANEKESINWLTLAASQGDARARYTLAGQYFLGIGTEVDTESAMANLVMASLGGWDEARNMALGMRPTLSPSRWESIASRINWAQITFVMGKSTSGTGPGGVQIFETDAEWSAESSEWLRQEQNVANELFLRASSPSILSGAFGTEVSEVRQSA